MSNIIKSVAFLTMLVILLSSCAPSLDDCRDYAKRGEYDKAIKGYEKIINGKYSEKFSITKELLKLYEEKYPEKALKIAEILYKEDKGYKPLYERELVNMLDKLDKEGDYIKEINIVKDLIRINPHTKRWRYVIIRLLVNSGDFDMANAELDTISQLGDSTYRIDFYRGNIMLASGNALKAEEYYKKSLKENSDYLPPRLSLIRMMLDRKELKKAKREAKKLVERYPDYLEVYRLLADIYVASGDYNGAVPYIDKYNELTKTKVYKDKWYMKFDE